MAPPDPRTGARDDRVLALPRRVSLVVIPFLVVAFAVLVPWPSDTARLFAWAIKPTLTSMVLGSVYLGGAYFFLRAFLAKEWHTVVSRIMAVVGGLSLLTGAFLFLLPNQAVSIWPWTLTPLTSRVLGAIFCLGMAGL